MSIRPVAEGLYTIELQPTLNHYIAQQNSRRTNNGDGEVSQRNELTIQARGRVARELIENDGAESYSFELAERSERVKS